jgi:hypothetical protein
MRVDNRLSRRSQQAQSYPRVTAPTDKPPRLYFGPDSSGTDNALQIIEKIAIPTMASTWAHLTFLDAIILLLDAKDAWEF